MQIPQQVHTALRNGDYAKGTAYHYVRIITHLLDLCHGYGVDWRTLTPADAQVIYAEVTGHLGRVSKTTFRAAARFLYWAHYLESPFRWVRLPKRHRIERRYLTQPEVTAWLAQLQQAVPAGRKTGMALVALRLAYLLLMTGCRISEVRTLTVSDVVFAGTTPRALRLIEKGGDFQMLDLPPMAAELVGALVRDAGPDGCLFPSIRRGPMSYPAVRLRFLAAATAAGITGWTGSHVCRHTVAARVLEHTDDLRVVQQVLRHTSISSTEFYAHLLPARVSAAIACAQVLPACAALLEQPKKKAK